MRFASSMARLTGTSWLGRGTLLSVAPAGSTVQAQPLRLLLITSRFCYHYPNLQEIIPARISGRADTAWDLVPALRCGTGGLLQARGKLDVDGQPSRGDGRPQSTK